MLKKVIAFASILAIAGCSTVYQKLSSDGGYSDMKLGSDTYLVEYKSNGYTDKSTNFKHALRRSAEVTRNNGYKYFQIINIVDNSKFSTFNGYSATYPNISMTVKMSHKNATDSYCARDILSNF